MTATQYNFNGLEAFFEKHDITQQELSQTYHTLAEILESRKNDNIVPFLHILTTTPFFERFVCRAYMIPDKPDGQYLYDMYIYIKIMMSTPDKKRVLFEINGTYICWT